MQSNLNVNVPILGVTTNASNNSLQFYNGISSTNNITSIKFRHRNTLVNLNIQLSQIRSLWKKYNIPVGQTISSESTLANFAQKTL